MLDRTDMMLQPILQVPKALPQPVEKATALVVKHCEATVNLIDETIANLQATIAELEERRNKLIYATDIATDFANLARYERESCDRVMSLALVKGGVREQD